MGNKNQNQQLPDKTEQTIGLKGTFIAVMLLGVFILVSWFGIYALFYQDNEN